MVFSNLFFLYIFLPLNLLFYSLAKTIPAKNAVMLVFSLFFYAWGEPKYVLLLVGMVFADWIFALLIENSANKKTAGFWLVLACIVNLGSIGIFKYGTFIAANLKALTGYPAVIPAIALPIGISFYTFQILSYVIDVYRGEVKAQRNFAHLLMYVSLFHQCIAGPIVRYSDVSAEIIKRQTNIPQISAGITRFAVGLAKKALLANTCGLIADAAWLTDSAAAEAGNLAANSAVLASRPAAFLWLGALAFTLQIYLDFSAYSDMAIGMGLMIGFHYKENFLYPYTANSVSHFWRLWHISLSSFFRDYVYFPLGGSRRGLARTVFNLFIVWLLTGLWHGASWNFVLWGLYFFVFIAAEKVFLAGVLKKLPKVFGHIYTLTVVLFSWVLFRFRQLPLGWLVFKGMFALNKNPFTSFETKTMWLNYIFFLAVAIIAVTPLVKKISDYFASPKVAATVPGIIINYARIPAVILSVILSTFALVGNSYNPFLYFQF